MTSRYHGSKISGSQESIGSFCNGDGEQQKDNRFSLAKTNAFLYISWPLSHDCDMKLPNFTRPLYGVGEHNTTIFFS